MAKLVGRLPLDLAERKVAVALKNQLPETCVVIPGVRWAYRAQSQHGRGPVRDGEADVVVLWPGLGLLVVEVKGSREMKVDSDGWWRKEDSGWVRLDRDPVDQATSNAYKITEIIRSERGWPGAFPGLFGWLVAYPNGEAQSVPPRFDHTTLATRRDMDSLQNKVRNALEAREDKSARKKDDVAIPARFTEAVVEACRSILTSEGFRIVPADGAEEASADGQQIERLTKQQFGALRGLFDFPSLTVTGPAGSGKTILAISRLEAAVSDDQRAIYVCYNRALAEALRAKNPGLASSIHSVDQFFGTICPGARRGDDANTFYRVTLPNDVFDVVTAWPESNKYDVVLVDEAQDFSFDQIFTLQRLAKERTGAFAMFMDKRQDVYQQASEGGVDERLTETSFRLLHNCRNAVRINFATNGYFGWSAGAAVPSLPGMPEGVPVTVERVSRQAMANRAFELASVWKRNGSASVAILSPFQRQNSAMASLHAGHGLQISENLDALSGQGTVFFSTIKSFKGLEADCVILVDAQHPNGSHVAFRREDLYVACTRARTRLAILASDPDVAAAYR